MLMKSDLFQSAIRVTLRELFWERLVGAYHMPLAALVPPFRMARQNADARNVRFAYRSFRIDSGSRWT
jgi:hypothetical protein